MYGVDEESRLRDSFLYSKIVIELYSGNELLGEGRNVLIEKGKVEWIII